MVAVPPQQAFIPSEQTGDYKWYGAALVGEAVFFTPKDNPNILTLHTAHPPIQQRLLLLETDTQTSGWERALAKGKARRKPRPRRPRPQAMPQA